MVKKLLLSVLLSPFVALAQNSLLIENVNIVSSHLPAPKQGVNVLIIDDRIVDITNKKISVFDSKIDGTGKYLTPGIMDSHAHVSSIPGMGFGVEAVAMKHKELAKSYYQQQPSSFLYYGVTQVLDPNPGANYQHFTANQRHPDYFRCEVITSANTFPYVEKTDDSSRSMFRYVIDEKAGAGEDKSVEVAVQQIAESGASCIKIYMEDGYGNASYWPLLSSATLKRIRTAADKMGLPILAHANALDMQEVALAENVDVIAHGMWNWGQFAGAKTLPKEITRVLDKIQAANIGFMPTQRVIAGLGEVMLDDILATPEFSAVTPKALLNWYQTDEAQWFKEELVQGFDGLPAETIAEIFLYGRIGNGNKVIRYLNDKKHPILLASDFPGSPSFANQPGLTTFQEMKALVNAGLSLDELLAAATINNARQFNLDKDYGTVEVGKVANLLLLTKNPLTSVDAWNSIELVLLHGKPITRDSLSVKSQ